MLEINKHKTILLQILKDIYTDISIAPVLVFKGGTACFLFYGLPRFSVDLDFDLLDTAKEEPVFEKMEKILGDYGQVKKKYRKKNTLFFLLSYEQGVRNIKVEISRRDFSSSHEIKNYLGISMLVMKKEDVFAHKLVALLDRSHLANRDLYDIGFFLKNRWDINHSLIEERTKMEFPEYIGKCIKTVEKVNERYILAGLGELLNEKQKSFVRDKLKDEILFLLKLMLTESLTPKKAKGAKP